MTTICARIVRLTAASALALALGVAAAGPTLADSDTRSGTVENGATLAADDSSTPDGVGKPGGIKSVEDGATPDGVGRGGGINSVEDGAGTDALILADDSTPAAWASPNGQIQAI